MTSYNDIFNVTNRKNNFFITVSINDVEFNQTTFPPGVYEVESVNKKTKRNNIKEGFFPEEKNSIVIKPNFTTLGSYIVIKLNFIGSQNCLVQDDRLGGFLVLNPEILCMKYILSPHHVDIKLFDNFLLETDITQGMFCKGKRIGLSHNFGMEVNPGYKHIEQFRGIIQWYVMNANDFISKIILNQKKKRKNWYHSTVNQ